MVVFLSYTYDEAWNLIMNIREATESLEDKESIMSNSSSEYVCVNDFLADEKTCEMIKTLGIDSYSVRKIIENYAGHLQVPTDWKHYKPPEEKKRARESAPIVEFSLEPTQEITKKKRKEEEHLKRRLKKPWRYQSKHFRIEGSNGSTNGG